MMMMMMKDNLLADVSGKWRPYVRLGNCDVLAEYIFVIN